MINPGLYAIADTASMRTRGLDFAETIDGLIRGNAVMIQYRDKSNDSVRRKKEATILVGYCRDAGIPAIINDDIELARASGAHGVHLGEDDATIRDARDRLGPDAIVGASCYDSVDRAHQAAGATATYVAFGRAYPSTTKPGGPTATLALFRQARQVLDIPICAIGGITPTHVPQLLGAGVSLTAVIHGLYASGTVSDNALRYAHCFHAPSATHPR